MISKGPVIAILIGLLASVGSSIHGVREKTFFHCILMAIVFFSGLVSSDNEMNEKQEYSIGNSSLSRREFLSFVGISVAAGITSSFFFDPKNIKSEIQISEEATSQTSQSTEMKEPIYTQDDPSLYTIERPNIIFILGDNHNYETMGCVGHPFIQTPGLDRLASEGLIFENAFCTTPLCSPSRASILTGLYAHNHGV